MPGIMSRTSDSEQRKLSSTVPWGFLSNELASSFDIRDEESDRQVPRMCMSSRSSSHTASKEEETQERMTRS